MIKMSEDFEPDSMKLQRPRKCKIVMMMFQKSKITFNCFYIFSFFKSLG